MLGEDLEDGSASGYEEEDVAVDLEPRRSSRRGMGKGSGENKRNKALQALKAQKDAKSKGYSYTEIEEEEEIFDLVDDQEHASRARNRMDDDFIVEDGKEETGYVDHGQDWWNEEHDYSSADEDEREVKQKKEKKKKSSLKGGQTTLNFLTANRRKTTAAAPIKKKVTEDDNNFFDNLMKDFNSDDEDSKQKSKKRSALETGRLDKSPKKTVESFEAEPSLDLDPMDYQSTKTPKKKLVMEEESDQETGFSPTPSGEKEVSPATAKFAKPDSFSLPSSIKKTTTTKKNVNDFASVYGSVINSDDDVDDDDDDVEKTNTSATFKVKFEEKENEEVSSILAKKIEPVSTTNNLMDMPDDDEDDEEAKDLPALETEKPTPKPEESLNTDSNSWWKLRQQQQGSQSSIESNYKASNNFNTKLPTSTDEEGNEILSFYWIDLAEEPNHPGVVFLFGKVFCEDVNDFISCTIAVQNIQRDVYVLPKEKVIDENGEEIDTPFTMLYEEITFVMDKNRIKKWGCKKVTRNYSFELAGVPATSDYMKIKYPYTSPALPSSVEKGNTFSRVFGKNTSALENFLLKRKLMGPCWLQIKNPKKTEVFITWSKLECFVEGQKDVTILKEKKEVPKLRVASLSIKTVLSPKTHKHEIIIASLMCHKAVNIDGPTPNPESQYTSCSIIRELKGAFPFDFQNTVKSMNLNVQAVQGERYLLNCYMAKIHKFDPDVIVAHNLFGFELDVLFHRMNELKISSFSKMGRFRRSKMPNLGRGDSSAATHKSLISGRLGLATYLSCKEFIKVKSYSLKELAATQLDTQRNELHLEQIPNMFDNTQSILSLIQHSEQDGYITMSLMFKLYVLPLTKQITTLSGNTWAKTLVGGRSERNEFLLLHEFHNRKYIKPDKSFSFSNTKAKKKKASYAGGLVFEPEKGFYDDYILLLDFNSLYPSIIQEYNLCFTTVERAPVNESNDDDDDESMQLAEVPGPDKERGVLPKLLEYLVERRKSVKQLIKSTDNVQEIAQLNIRQLALKLTANSMYGCLGFKGSRFYAKPIAELITRRGREILQATKELTENQLGLKVIYGDTDSIMVNSRSKDITEVKKLGGQVKRAVNKMYRLLELDIDGIYKTMLLLKKKKYAALAIQEKNGELTTVRELKGLDIVRRDWSSLAVEVGTKILDFVLSDIGRDKTVSESLEYLAQVANDLKNNKIPLEKFVIVKGLTKPPKDYPDKKKLPHVQVAIKMKTKGLVVGNKDTIPYIICENDNSDPSKLLPSNSSIAQKAFHPDEVKSNKDLKVDINYYLKQQVHPVVSRLVEPIEELNPCMLAECLGLDSSMYANKDKENDDDEVVVRKPYLSDAERFKNVKPLTLTCNKCGTQQEMPNIVRIDDKNRISPGIICSKTSCNKPFSAGFLKARCKREIERYVDLFCQGVAVCDDVSCERRSRMPQSLNCMSKHCYGGINKPEYTSAMLFTQISYYKYLFDAKTFLKKKEEKSKDDLNNDDPVNFNVYKATLTPYEDQYQSVSDYVDDIICNKNGRGKVNLNSIMGKIFQSAMKS